MRPSCANAVATPAAADGWFERTRTTARPSRCTSDTSSSSALPPDASGSRRPPASARTSSVNGSRASAAAEPMGVVVDQRPCPSLIDEADTLPRSVTRAPVMGVPSAASVRPRSTSVWNAGSA